MIIETERVLVDGESWEPLLCEPVPESVIDLTGRVFDRLTVAGFHRLGSGSGTAQRHIWSCRCACGVYCRRRALGLRATSDILKACSACMEEWSQAYGKPHAGGKESRARGMLRAARGRIENSKNNPEKLLEWRRRLVEIKHAYPWADGECQSLFRSINNWLLDLRDREKDFFPSCFVGAAQQYLPKHQYLAIAVRARRAVDLIEGRPEALLSTKPMRFDPSDLISEYGEAAVLDRYREAVEAGEVPETAVAMRRLLAAEVRQQRTTEKIAARLGG